MICFGSDSSKNLKNLINNFTNSTNTNHSDDSDNENKTTSDSSPNIDFETILKMKNIMEALNTKKNDPRANLLRSLKPYLKDERKNKVDQYVQILNMSSVFDMFRKTGGDENTK